MAGGKPLRSSGGVTCVIGLVKYASRVMVAGPSTVSASAGPRLQDGTQRQQRHGRERRAA